MGRFYGIDSFKIIFFTMFLGINTASRLPEFAILKDKMVLADIFMGNSSMEAETLLPQIKKTFEDLNKKLSEISKILVIRGPGPFTSLRVGVTLANTLAYGLKADIYSIDLFQLYFLKDTEGKAKKCILQGGKEVVFIKSSADENDHVGQFSYQNFPWEKINKKGYNIGEVAEDFWTLLRKINVEFRSGNELLSFAAALKKVNFNTLKKEKIVLPMYVRPPDISKSKKPLCFTLSQHQ